MAKKKDISRDKIRRAILKHHGGLPGDCSYSAIHRIWCALSPGTRDKYLEAVKDKKE